MRLMLKHEWNLDERIGGGGFGQVYAASSPDYGSPAVAKLVPKAPGAQRELLFEELGGARNVVPIIDSGETDDCWVLIMPRAEKSLRQHLLERAGPLTVSEAVAVLSNVATALADLDGRVVHRDLKPENILLLGGNWCLADFGIARFAEATTAPDTRKFAWSPPYAAPERWRDERATAATDVYSLGVIAYELLSGSLPFAGPATHDLREQHLRMRPPSLGDVPMPLGALIDECLYKAPATRPTPAKVLARLARIEDPAPSGGLARLREAHRAEVARVGEIARHASEHRSEGDRRAALFDDADIGFKRVAATLERMISEAAPAAAVEPGREGGWRIRLNNAELELVLPRMTSASPWGSWQPPAFEVIAHAAIGIRIPPGREEYEGRSHSLWFCDARDAGNFQWFETAFMFTPLGSKRGRQNPFALDPGKQAAKALWMGVAEFQLAWPFTPLDVGDLRDFVDRWASWFADAAEGRLQHPGRMPEHSAEGSWRRA